MFYDIVILGGGSAGYSCALRAAQLGLNVCLIEGDKVGGTCLHRGCIPTKALLHCAEVVDTVNESEKFGVASTFNGIDMAKVTEYKNGVISRLFKGLQGLIASRKVTYIQGWGKLVAPDTIVVNGQEVKGKNIVLATGSASRSLPGLEIGARVITSDEALQLQFVPRSAIILGGGVIGVEFASIYKSMGCDVTIIEGLPNLVPNEDKSVSKFLERSFSKRGIKFTTGTLFSSVVQNDDGVVVTCQDGKTFEAEVLLVAVGRRPVTENMGFEECGIKIDRGFVQTNDKLHTGVGNIYAGGDIVFGVQLAHRGFAHGIFIAEQIAGLNPTLIKDVNIPKVTYCKPEVASVGLTQSQAEEKFGKENVEVVEYNLAGNGKSQILATTGFIKLVREKNGPICGFHAIGERVGELVSEGELMVNWEALPEDVADLIHAHPTQNEAIGEAAMALAGKPLHAHN